jgi:Flp pilus assembly protein TadG
MTKTRTNTPKSGQGMTEFALVLPVLLLIVLGLIEVGRLIFLYSTVTNASREAARYGSATGLSDSGIPRFQDQAGIRDAAKRVGFLVDLQDEDIAIQYDQGGTCQFPVNMDRILVTVTTNYSPIVPVPFVPMQSFPITATSQRTIICRVVLAMTALPSDGGGGGGGGDGGGGGGGGEEATATSEAEATETVEPTPEPTNTPTPESTPTPSQTPTASPTASATPTPSNTPTPTETFTPTTTFTATSTPIACDVRHSVLKLSPFGMTIFNYGTVPVTIAEITIFYNNTSPAEQAITKIILGSSTNEIWSGFRTGSPATFLQSELGGDLIIEPGSNRILETTFNKTYSPNDTERILVSFVENGCPILDSDNDNQLP